MSLKGAWDLWQKGKGSADEFNTAKTFATLGTGMALVVWFGGFIVVGGALFAMAVVYSALQKIIAHGSYLVSFGD